VSTLRLPGLHTPRRPSWDCRECDQQWPCPQARAALVEHFGALLPRTMAALVEAAAADGLAADLYPRMIEWTEPVKLPAGAPRRPPSPAGR
jgi:hypothetical protein